MSKHAAAARAVFEKNPEIEVLYFTKDGQAFTNEHYAKIHNKTQGSKEVEKVTRGDVMKGAKAESAEPVSVAADAPVAAENGDGKKKKKG